VNALGRVQVDGVEQIPATGPVILAMNHRSLIDGPLLFGFVDRPVACLVKSEAFGPVIGTLLTDAGQIRVTRGTVDPRPVRLCLQILDAGGVIGIFPEGTRGDGRVRSAKPGVGYFALRTGAAVVPIACHGSAELIRSVRRHPVRLSIGAPLRFPQVPRGIALNRRLSAEATERVRGELAELVSRTSTKTQGVPE
jgi:1-acyl-sn-glycerol-3-phosphate acyltransferase